MNLTGNNLLVLTAQSKHICHSNEYLGDENMETSYFCFVLPLERSLIQSLAPTLTLTCLMPTSRSWGLRAGARAWPLACFLMPTESLKQSMKQKKQKAHQVILEVESNCSCQQAAEHAFGRKWPVIGQQVLLVLLSILRRFASIS